MTRFRFPVYFAAMVVLTWSSAARAQVLVNTNFTPAASPADWHVNANWTIQNGPQAGQNFAPDGTFNEGAIINGGQTAQVSTVLNESTSPRGPGHITVTTGTLEIQDSGNITLVQPGAGSLVTRTTTINDKLRMLGNGKLNTTTLTFGANSDTTIQFSAATSSPLNVTGLATLNGKLNLDYTAIPSSLGTKTLITAGTTLGNFSSITTTGLSAAQSVVVNRKNGLVTATRANVPTLTINRDNGSMTLQNTHLSNIPLDGLQIRSALGALDPTKFSGLPSAGWSVAGSNTRNSVAQVYEGPNTANPSFAYAPGAPVQVGTNGVFHTPTPQFFLQETEDVIFEITDASLPAPIRGVVNYTGQKVINNNIALTINPAGQAVLLNQSPFPQNIEMYRITSSGSPLQTDTWNPLANQSGLDNDTWSVSATSDTGTLLEVTEAGSSLFNSTNLYQIGQILDPGFMQSGITFEYLIEGAAAFTTGAVVFGTHPVVSSRLGDFNNDGKVDAADYTVWRNNFGAVTDASISNNGDQVAGITQADYTVWKQNFGATYSGSGSAAGSGSTQVPEPSAFVLLVVAVSATLMSRRSIG